MSNLMTLTDEDAVRAAGKLFHEWVLDPDTRPPNPEKIKEALSDDDIGIKFDDKVKRVHIIQHTETDFYLTLPPKESLEARIKANENGESYDLPSPYTELPPGLSDPAKLAFFYLFRLGDYVLQHCR